MASASQGEAAAGADCALLAADEWTRGKQVTLRMASEPGMDLDEPRSPDDSRNGGSSGAGSWRAKIRDSPYWLSINCFCGAICVLILVHGALCTGYITSVITTIEKRFEIRSRTSGLVISSYEIGSLISVLFVSYYGSRGHIPRLVGLGALILASGAFLFSLPHFLASPPPFNETLFLSSTKLPDKCHDPAANATGAPDDSAHVCTPEEVAHSAGSYVFVLVIAQVLLGIGGSPIFTLGTTYIDNHVSKESSSVYLAVMYVMVALGPVCGFILGAFMISQYVSPPKPAELPDSAFIGLWWGGFLLLGLSYLLAAIPFFGFPKRLPSAHTAKVTEYVRSIRQIPVSALRLLSNSVYMVSSLNACMDLAIVSGFTVYLPKYLETQYGVSKSKASILTGGVAIPGAIVGILLGGLLMKRYKLQLRGISGLILTVNVTATALLALFFFFGCSNLDLAGVFSRYNQLNIPNPLQKSTLNLTDPCNIGCGCSPDEYQPVCGKDGKTYFSPCFAGCHTMLISEVVERQTITGKVSLQLLNYTDCSCIPFNYTRVALPAKERVAVARLGLCQSGCQMLKPFLLLLFVLTLVASNNQMPLIMVTLRSVSEEEKAFALGFQVVLLRLLAYIPAPIIFGSVIDTTCLVWKPTSCGAEGTTCLLYDIETFRMRYGSIAMIFKVIAVSLSALLWWCVRQREQSPDPFSAPITMSEIAHRLGDVENLHIATCRPPVVRTWMSDDSLYNPRARSPKRHQKTMSC